MIKYRVIIKVSYYEAWFEFDSIEDAGEFAKTALMYNVPSKDRSDFEGVRIEVVNTDKEKESEDDE